MCRADLPSGSCSICLANEGPHTLEEIAVHFKCTRENIRLIEEKALEKVRKRLLWVSRSSGRSRDEP